MMAGWVPNMLKGVHFPVLIKGVVSMWLTDDRVPGRSVVKLYKINNTLALRVLIVEDCLIVIIY